MISSMWNATKEQWEAEVQRSLKLSDMPNLTRKIFSAHTISPFSEARDVAPFQIPRNPQQYFLTIQNYTDLQNSQLQEWLEQPDTGFRFRELKDLMSATITRTTSYKAYLSQPFPFQLSAPQCEFLARYAGQGNEVNLGWSPLSFGLTRGEILKRPFLGWDKIFGDPALQAPGVSWFYLSSAPYQWAGAEPHVELAIILSLAYSVVRELDELKIPFSLSRQKIHFGLALGTDVLVETAKVPALKLLWRRLSELLGEKDEVDPEIYAMPSLRYFSGRDPWNNVLRLTLMSFAAICGGAAGFKCIPYDALNKRKSKEALRVSTNIPGVLIKEGGVANVMNPLDGASLFADTVDQMCEAAWTFFQEIEKKGGIFEAVRSGWIQMELKRSAEYSKNQLAYLQKELIGVNKFIQKNLKYEAQSSDIIRLGDIIDPLFLTKSADDYLTVEPLLVEALSYEWEMLQIHCDRIENKTGSRPQVHVIKGAGPVVEKKVAWLTGILSLSGLGVDLKTADDAGSMESFSKLVILVPSNDEMENQLTSSLKVKGVEKVWAVAPAKEESKVDRYFDSTVQVLEFAKDIHSQLVEVL